MKNTILLTLIALLTIVFHLPSNAIASDLYHEEVSYKAKEGKDLIMQFDELERHPNFSIVKVKYTSGASVPSIMFLVKGCYEIAKIRGVGFFVNLKEWPDKDGNQLYKIGYTSDKTNDPFTYFGDDIDKTKDLGYFSVKDYALIFEKK